MEQIRGYVMKYGFIWLGWTVVKRKVVTQYYDNIKEITLEPEMNIEYVTVSLSKKLVYKRINKNCLKIYQGGGK